MPPLFGVGAGGAPGKGRVGLAGMARAAAGNDDAASATTTTTTTIACTTPVKRKGKVCETERDRGK
jgi:hypothetical protein